MARVLVILTFLTGGLIAAGVVYITTVNHEIENFRVSYEQSSVVLLATIRQRLETILWVAQTFTTEISTDTNETHWPNVTLSNFPARCRGPIMLTRTTMISFAPKLTSHTFDAWNQYAATNYRRVKEPMMNEFDVIDTGVTYFQTDRSINDGVYKIVNGMTQSVNANGRYGIYPIWQLSHLPNTTLQDEIDSEHNQSIIGILFDEASTSVRMTALHHLHRRRGSIASGFLYEDRNGTDFAYYEKPATTIYYPIFFNETDLSPIVGVIGFQLSWESMLCDILGNQITKQLVVVVENQCGDQFSFSIKGNNVSFLGPGDRHDVEVLDYKKVYNTSYSDFVSLFHTHGAPMLDSSSSDIPCAYRITVYPSLEFKALVSILTPKFNLIPLNFNYFTNFVILCISVCVYSVVSYISYEKLSIRHHVLKFFKEL
jgi:hypothetical protein